MWKFHKGKILFIFAALMKTGNDLKILRGVLLMIFLISAILSFSVHSLPIQDKVAKENTSTNEDSENQKETEHYLLSYEAVVPMIQFQLDHHFYITFDLPLVEINEFIFDLEIPYLVSSYFTTLFEHIISPNAP